MEFRLWPRHTVLLTGTDFDFQGPMKISRRQKHIKRIGRELWGRTVPAGQWGRRAYSMAVSCQSNKRSPLFKLALEETEPAVPQKAPPAMQAATRQSLAAIQARLRCSDLDA